MLAEQAPELLQTPSKDLSENPPNN